MYGSSLSHMAQANGMDVPGLQEAIYASVKDDVRNQLVINTVAEREGIVLEDADRQAFAESNGQDVEDAVAYYGQETFDEMALNYKVMKFMADNASNVAETTETVSYTHLRGADQHFGNRKPGMVPVRGCGFYLYL